MIRTTRKMAAADGDLGDDEMHRLRRVGELLGQFLGQAALVDGEIEGRDGRDHPGEDRQHLAREPAVHRHQPGDDHDDHQGRVEIGNSQDHDVHSPVRGAPSLPAAAERPFGQACANATYCPHAPSHSPSPSAKPLTWVRRDNSSLAAGSSRSPAAGRTARLKPELAGLLEARHHVAGRPDRPREADLAEVDILWPQRNIGDRRQQGRGGGRDRRPAP